MLKNINILLTACVIILITGCSFNLTAPKNFNCPVPSQNCSPAKWEGLALDTSSAYRNVADYFYVFENLKQINSPEDEWGISFLDKKKAILTVNDRGEQRMMLYHMINDRKGTLESGIGVPMEGNVGNISARGKSAVFSASPSITNLDEMLGNSDLYTADLHDNVLVNVAKIEGHINENPSIWESQPALSPDGNVIFFSTDKKPYVGTDIFFIIKMSDGSWSDPINCGDSINSSCDEISPFITTDGKMMLYSSNGRETIGGYDIFSTNISPEFWEAAKRKDTASLKRKSYFSRARNMRPPLNTPVDEIFPSSPGDINELLYYSSNQYESSSSIAMRKGGFDIFLKRKVVSTKVVDNQQKLVAQDITPKFDVNLDDQVVPTTIKIPQSFSLEGSVFNARTNQFVPKADISVMQLRSDSAKPEKDKLLDQSELEVVSQWKEIYYESFKTRANDSGNYKIVLEKGIDYIITAQAENLFFDTKKVRVEKDDPNTRILMDFRVPEKLTLRVNFPTDVYKNPYKYTLDSNGIETNRTWKEEIELLTKNLLLSLDKINKIVLTGHTDDVGSEEYNMKLGQNRVNFVVEQLTKGGVPLDKLLDKSAGKMQPLQKRETESLQSYRKRLRRVELEKELK